MSLPHRRLPFVLLLLIACLIRGPDAHAAPPARVPVIVTLNPAAGDPDAATDALRKAYGLTIRKAYRHALRGFAAEVNPGDEAALAHDPRVAHLDPDLPVAASAQTSPTGIRFIGADHNATARIGTAANAVNVDVAVLDTGIDATHPELSVAGGVDCSGTGGWADDNGHGTHVSGTIGALDNGTGVVGVAPGARLWAVKVLDSTGSGSWSSIICGIDWVTQNAATISVANMSLGGSGADGGPCASTSLHQAICNAVNAGVTFTVAAGNNAADASAYVPASCPEVITVGALTDFNGAPGGGASPNCSSGGVDDAFASYSNSGAAVTLLAPGTCIYSTTRGGGYGWMTGTSMATPHAAGAAALYIAAHGRVGPLAVKSGLVAASRGGEVSAVPAGTTGQALNVSDGWSMTAASRPTPSPTATKTANLAPIDLEIFGWQALEPDRDVTCGLLLRQLLADPTHELPKDGAPAAVRLFRVHARRVEDTHGRQPRADPLFDVGSIRFDLRPPSSFGRWPLHRLLQHPRDGGTAASELLRDLPLALASFDHDLNGTALHLSQHPFPPSVDEGLLDADRVAHFYPDVFTSLADF